MLRFSQTTRNLGKFSLRCIKLDLTTKIYFLRWSPDSEKLALFAEKDGKNTWAIFEKDGNYLTHIGRESKELAIDFTWSPSSEHLLANCDLVRAGQSATYNLCLYNLRGELEKKFFWQSYRNSIAYLDNDEQYIYYLLANAPPSLGSRNFSASLVRIDVQSGEEQVIGEGMNDLSWISSRDYWEIYGARGAEIRESPDGTFFVFNNIGNFIDLKEIKDTYGSRNPKTLYTVICSESSGCKDFKLGELNVVGAAWWPPPSGWKPAEILLSEVYLADLDYSTAMGYDRLGVGVFPFSEGPAVAGKVIKAEGKEYAYGLFAHAPYEITYDLRNKYSVLKTTLVMANYSECVSNGALFRVLVDGKEVFLSDLLTPANTPLTVEIPITGKQLTLETLPGPNDDNGCDWSVWGDPVLIP